MDWRSRAFIVVILAAIAGSMPSRPVEAQLGDGCDVRGYGIDSDREGAPINMRVRRNTTCWFDMRFGAEGLMVTNAPDNGRVEVQGARVTYTPAPNYRGTDHFVLQSRGAMMSSGRRRPSVQLSVEVLVTR